MKYTSTVENLPESRVKILVTIPWKEVETKVKGAKKKVLAEADIKGFRKGSVPEDVFVKQFGDFPFYQEAAYAVVDATYVTALTENKVLAIGRPEVNLTSFGQDKDVVYEILVDVMPEVKLPDYKKLHTQFAEIPADVVGEEEVAEAIKDIKAWRKQKPNMTDEEKKAAAEAELSDEDLKAMGVESGKLEDLENKIRENLTSEKIGQAKDKRRTQILDALVNGVEGDMPKAMVDNELLKMQDRITADLSQMGVGFPDYLKHLNKTEEEWRESEKVQATKNAKLQVALAQISKLEKMAPSDVAIAKEVEHLKMHYPDIDEARLREYSIERMTNTFVLEYILTGETPKEEELFKVDHEH
jgi:FKBP-type peptidyl-prolyl cis-trans isomerase (trigger factor)